MVTREEFDRLLDDYVTAYGAAILVSTRAGTAYPDALERAAEARQALGKAVFP